MKKLSKLFLMGAVVLGLGLTACNNEDVNGPVDESKANTHVSITLSMSTKGTRAGLPNDYNYIGEWAGKDKIETIAVYLVDGTSVNAKTFDVGAGKDYEVVNNAGTLTIIPKLETAAIKTTAGTKKVYVLINGSAEVVAHLNKTPVAEFEDAYQKVALALANQGNAATSVTSASKLAKVDTGEDVIVMTNVQPEALVVKPNISAAQTIGAATGGDPANNRVSLNVERSVARVMVTIANNQNFTVPANGTGTVLGTISNVTWVLAQGENSLFVQRKAQWETPNYGWKPTSTEPYLNAAGKYDYSGLFEGYQPAPNYGGTAVPTIADYSTAPAIGTESLLKGKFILPTTHQTGVKTASDYKKGNTAYVLIRAHFTPSDAAYADGGTYTTGADFFVGANGKFYTSAENAVDPTKGGVKDQTVARYVGGKVLYYAWVNPDNVTTNEWYNSPVLRNNIYHIHITGFKTIGTNWNPLFPEDPDNPQTPANGGNPDPKPSVPGVTEPENPIDPEDPLTTPETWMSVDVTVLPWLVHSYEVDLGI